MQPPVETQHAEARTVVQRGVLKGPAPRDLHVLHVDLNGLARLRLLEQLHLAGFPLSRAPQSRQADVTKDPLNRAHGQPGSMHTLQPEPRTASPVAQLLASLADQLDGCGGHPPLPVPGIGRHPPLDASATPAFSPPANRPSTDSIVPAGCSR